MVYKKELAKVQEDNKLLVKRIMDRKRITSLLISETATEVHMLLLLYQSIYTMY